MQSRNRRAGDRLVAVVLVGGAIAGAVVVGLVAWKATLWWFRGAYRLGQIIGGQGQGHE